MISILLLDSLKQGEGSGNTGTNTGSQVESPAPQSAEDEMDSTVAELLGQQGVVIEHSRPGQHGASVKDVGEGCSKRAVEKADKRSDERVMGAGDDRAERLFRSEYGVTPREAWAFVNERLPPG